MNKSGYRFAQAVNIGAVVLNLWSAYGAMRAGVMRAFVSDIFAIGFSTAVIVLLRVVDVWLTETSAIRKEELRKLLAEADMAVNMKNAFEEAHGRGAVAFADARLPEQDKPF